MEGATFIAVASEAASRGSGPCRAGERNGEYQVCDAGSFTAITAAVST